jgi:hypothetical protein
MKLHAGCKVKAKDKAEAKEGIGITVNQYGNFTGGPPGKQKWPCLSMGSITGNP